MEVFNVNSCTEEGIDLKSDQQLESLLEKIKDSAEIMIKWTQYQDDDDGDSGKVAKSKILLTDSLMSRIKDGRFSLTSTREIEEQE